MFVAKPDVTHPPSIRMISPSVMLEAAIHFYNKNKKVFVCVEQGCISRRAGATVALYLEDK